MRCPMSARTVVCVPLVFVVVIGALVLRPAVARADGGDPIGAFDFVSRFGPSQFNDCAVFPCGPVHSVWTVAGWAADPDAAGQSVRVDLYLDGTLLGQDQTGLGPSRPDVAAVYPWAGDRTGWDRLVYIHDDGPHTLCAYAINVGEGTQNTTLGCRSFAAGTDDAADPRGYVDDVVATPGLIQLRGWAGDPDADTPTVLLSYLDGQPFASFTGDLPRDDVHAVFPDLGNAAGYDQALPVLPGLHILCVDALNGGQGGSNNPSLGCWLLDVPNGISPGPNGARGSFDAAVYTPSGNPSGDPYWMQGWAWDPTASPAVVRDRYLDKVDVSFCACSTVRVVDQPTGDPRPDVQQAFPDAPPDTGFKVPFVRPDISNAYTPYHLYDCLYIETTGGEAFLGCQPLQRIQQ